MKNVGLAAAAALLFLPVIATANPHYQEVARCHEDSVGRLKHAFSVLLPKETVNAIEAPSTVPVEGLVSTFRTIHHEGAESRILGPVDSWSAVFKVTMLKKDRVQDNPGLEQTVLTYSLVAEVRETDRLVRRYVLDGAQSSATASIAAPVEAGDSRLRRYTCTKPR